MRQNLAGQTWTVRAFAWEAGIYGGNSFAVGQPVTGLAGSISATISQDGNGPTALSDSDTWTELGGGVYRVTLNDAAETNGSDLELFPTGPTGVTVLACPPLRTTLDGICDAMLTRDVAEVEADAPQCSLATLLLATTNKANTTAHAGKLTVYRTDGVTEHAQIPITSDPSAVPIDGIG